MFRYNRIPQISAFCFCIDLRVGAYSLAIVDLFYPIFALKKIFEVILHHDGIGKYNYFEL